MLLVATAITSFAREKNADSKLFSDVSATFKNSSQLSWTTKDRYQQASFSFRNQAASAYYSLENNELIGFRIQLNKTELPQVVSESIKAKYGNWEVVDAITFIDASGHVNYFTQVYKDNKSIILKTTPDGKLSVYSRMSI